MSNVKYLARLCLIGSLVKPVAMSEAQEALHCEAHVLCEAAHTAAVGDVERIPQQGHASRLRILHERKGRSVEAHEEEQ